VFLFMVETSVPGCAHSDVKIITRGRERAQEARNGKIIIISVTKRRAPGGSPLFWEWFLIKVGFFVKHGARERIAQMFAPAQHGKNGAKKEHTG
jgi:hypothetical protein